MDEQEATDELERLAGGPQKAHQLLNLYRACRTTASGNSFTLAKRPTAEQLFKKRAREHGFSHETIEHFLDCL